MSAALAHFWNQRNVGYRSTYVIFSVKWLPDEPSLISSPRAHPEVRWFVNDRISHSYRLLESAQCQQSYGVCHVFGTGSDRSTSRTLLPQAGRLWCQPICQQPGPSFSASVSSWTLNPRRTCYFFILDPTWGKEALLPNCNRASQQRQTEWLGCIKSNHTWFFYPRAHFDLPRAYQREDVAFLYDQRFRK